MAQTFVRYASDPRPYFVGRKGTEGHMGEGFYWTTDRRKAHPFPGEEAAKDMVARILPEVPSHRFSFPQAEEV